MFSHEGRAKHHAESGQSEYIEAPSARFIVDLTNGDSDNRTPMISGESMSVAEYVAMRFLPERVAAKSTAGRRHYQSLLKHVLTPNDVDRMFCAGEPRNDLRLCQDPSWPYIGSIPLATVHAGHVELLITAASRKGYSSQTIKHIRNVVGTIFSQAIKDGHYSLENPARQVVLPAMSRREAHALTLNEILKVLGRMRYPEREVALMAISTSMSIAEICGLQWLLVNLSDQPLVREGVRIGPRSLAVRNRWYRGELSPVPSTRRKEIALSPLLTRVLRSLIQTRSYAWSDFVLSTRSGRPVNPVNLAARRLKRIGVELEMPWLSWQVFRRSRRSLSSRHDVHAEEQLTAIFFPHPSAAIPSPRNETSDRRSQR